jgi:hypothetical protein
MYIRVGDNAYRVDPSKDPQPSAPASSRPATGNRPAVGSEADPLMKQLEELKNTVSTTGSVRRNTYIKPKTGSTPDPKPTHSAASSISNLNRQSTAGSALSPPVSAVSRGSGNRSPSPIPDYRNSAEAIVGTHPSVSRSPSPNPPTAAFMVPKAAQPTGAEGIKEVITDYQQSLPGEHRSLSRNNSRNRQGSVGASTGPSPQQNFIQPPNQVGHAGVGAHGSRSSSPQPSHSRAPSPQPGQLVNRNSFIRPPVQSGAGIPRAPSPNTIGIALDPSGRVLHDEMAQRFQHQEQPSPSQPHLAMHQARMGGSSGSATRLQPSPSSATEHTNASSPEEAYLPRISWWRPAIYSCYTSAFDCPYGNVPPQYAFAAYLCSSASCSSPSPCPAVVQSPFSSPISTAATTAETRAATATSSATCPSCSDESLRECKQRFAKGQFARVLLGPAADSTSQHSSPTSCCCTAYSCKSNACHAVATSTAASVSSTPCSAAKISENTISSAPAAIHGRWNTCLVLW